MGFLKIKNRKYSSFFLNIILKYRKEILLIKKRYYYLLNIFETFSAFLLSE